MTKGRAVLPGKVFAGQTFFITFGGSKAHDFSGQDDKGKGPLSFRRHKSGRHPLEPLGIFARGHTDHPLKGAAH